MCASLNLQNNYMYSFTYPKRPQVDNTHPMINVGISVFPKTLWQVDKFNNSSLKNKTDELCPILKSHKNKMFLLPEPTEGTQSPKSV